MNPTLYKRLGSGGGAGSGPDTCAISLADYGLAIAADTYDCLPDGSWLSGFGFGVGFSSDWVLQGNLISEIARDTFDTYTVGSAPTGDGSGFSAAWVSTENFSRIYAFDDFEDDTIGTAPDSGGWGWGTDWTVT